MTGVRSEVALALVQAARAEAVRSWDSAAASPNVLNDSFRSSEVLNDSFKTLGPGLPDLARARRALRLQQPERQATRHTRL
jgi:hypothetical protein